MDFNDKVTLGRTGLKVGRLGISSSFGAPAGAYEEAFERGCNYFTLGTFLRSGSLKMKEAIGHIIRQGRRDDLVIAMLTYAHSAFLTETFLKRRLRSLGVEHTDILILGYFPKRPRKGILEGALKLKEKGLVRYIGITSHNRKLFPELLKDSVFDVFHIRYNAAHPGAETETFPFITREDSPGIVSFTATAWRKLLNPKKMPPGEAPLTAMDCYRYVLSNPSVDVCMMGAKNLEQMRENLKTLDQGPMKEAELKRIRKIGDYVHG